MLREQMQHKIITTGLRQETISIHCRMLDRVLFMRLCNCEQLQGQKERPAGSVTTGASVFIWTDAPASPSREESACVVGGGAVEAVFAEELQAMKSLQRSEKRPLRGLCFGVIVFSMLERAMEFSGNGN